MIYHDIIIIIMIKLKKQKGLYKLKSTQAALTKGKSTRAPSQLNFSQ